MGTKSVIECRVVAVDPTPRGLGFAILEGPSCLVDWGMTDVRMKSKHHASLGRLDTLIDRYHPEVLVLEDWRRPECRRCPRVKQLLRHLARFAARRGLRTFTVSRPLLRQTFADLDRLTKDELARAIVMRFPELEIWLPPHRKPWMSEDHRMAIFDAAAFGMAYFARGRSPVSPHVVRARVSISATRPPG